MRYSIERENQRKSSSRGLRRKSKKDTVISYFMIVVALISILGFRVPNDTYAYTPNVITTAESPYHTEHDEDDSNKKSSQIIPRVMPLTTTYTTQQQYDGYYDDSFDDNIADLAIEVSAISNADVINEIEIIEDKVIVKHFDLYTSILSSSGLSETDIGELISGTAMAGLEGDIYRIESENGINAFFTLAVASLESGYGTSSMAKNQNNLFGMIGKSFSTKSDGVIYFGNLMTNYFETGIEPTAISINTRYCEGTAWQYKIVSLMNTYAGKTL